MRKLVWGKTFVRSLRRTVKKHPDKREDIEDTLRLLSDDPFAPRLASHKLRGNLSGAWSCSAGYDMRIVFEFVRSGEGEDDILLLEIGTHDEVY